jgi:hypothetical protein
MLEGRVLIVIDPFLAWRELRSLLCCGWLMLSLSLSCYICFLTGWPLAINTSVASTHQRVVRVCRVRREICSKHVIPRNVVLNFVGMSLCRTSYVTISLNCKCNHFSRRRTFGFETKPLFHLDIVTSCSKSFLSALKLARKSCCSLCTVWFSQ